jgi:predicted nucleic acid binding AN1-type Zn finger protein
MSQPISNLIRGKKASVTRIKIFLVYSVYTTLYLNHASALYSISLTSAIYCIISTIFIVCEINDTRKTLHISSEIRTFDFFVKKSKSKLTNVSSLKIKNTVWRLREIFCCEDGKLIPRFCTVIF